MKQWVATVLAALVLSAPVLAEEEFLDPEQAFRFSARLESNRVFEVRYAIAEGYYLYRDRFHFEIEPATVALGAPQFPPAQWHEDEFFGRSRIFRDEVVIRIPLMSSIGAAEQVRLLVRSQGCADAGICYLPTTQSVDFELLGWLGGAKEAP